MNLKQAIEDRIKGLALENVDIIFVKERHLFDRISKIRIPGLNKKIQIMLVNEMDDLKALSHVDMRAIGWVREDKVKEQIKELLEYKSMYEALCK